MTAITLRNAHKQSQRALFRLILQVNAEFHSAVWSVQEWLVGQVRAAADAEGFVVEARVMGLSLQLGERWKRALDQWGKVFDRALVQAGSIPFGVLWTQHNAYMPRVQMQESLSQAEQESMIRLWAQRRDEALAAARQRVYSDRLNLSQRIWRLENGGLNDIRGLLSSAFVERTNAADLARRIEAQLGANQDLPRWTEDRLYRMDARQRARSTDGLLRDPAQRREGISYNALRLARTELQYAHHAVATEIARHAPWVLKRNVVLSPTHPKIDICDELVSQNPHPKDAELLPAHPNCLCRYEDVVMDSSDFVREARAWMRGENDFLDDYAGWLGTRNVAERWPAMRIADTLDFWLNTDSAGAAAGRLR